MPWTKNLPHVSEHQISRRRSTRCGTNLCITIYPVTESEEVFIFIIKNFLTWRFLKVLINGQSPETLTVNAGIPQASLFGPTLFLNYITDRPKHILRSYVNVYADDTVIYGRTLKSLDGWRLAADLSFDLTLTSQ